MSQVLVDDGLVKVRHIWPARVLLGHDAQLRGINPAECPA
jgi:hypothetical protein